MDKSKSKKKDISYPVEVKVSKDVKVVYDKIPETKADENVALIKGVLEMKQRMSTEKQVSDKILELIIKNGYDDEGVPNAWYTNELHQETLKGYIQEHSLLIAEMLEVFDDDKFKEEIGQYKFWETNICWLEMKINRHKDVERLFGVSLNTDDLKDYNIYKPVLSDSDCELLEPIEYNETQRIYNNQPLADLSVVATNIKLNAWNLYDRTRKLVKKHKPMTQAETNVIMQQFLDNPRMNYQWNDFERITSTATHTNTFRKQRERWFDRNIKSKDEQREIFRMFFKKITNSNQLPQFKDMLNLFGIDSAQPVNTKIINQLARKFKKYWDMKSNSQTKLGFKVIAGATCMVDFQPTDYDSLTNQPTELPTINDTYMRKAGDEAIAEVLDDLQFDKELLANYPNLQPLIDEMRESRRQNYKEFLSAGSFGNNKAEVEADKKIKAIKI